MNIAGILLAAGFSRRYGRDKRQIRLPDGRMLLEASLHNLTEVLDTVVLAVREYEPWLDSIIQTNAPIHVVEVPQTRGLGDTLASAVQFVDSLTEIDATLVALADMPWVSLSTLQKLGCALETSAIVVPGEGGMWGHPVGFQACYFKDLMNCQGDEGARWLLQRERKNVTVIPVDDPGIFADIDSPENDGLLRI